MDTKSKANIKILLADDMPMMLIIIKNILKKLEYPVPVTAPDGAIAYDKLRSGNFDLAIVDWMMPELDGIGLLKKVRSDEKLKDLPIIMLTAKTEMDEVKEALKAGANDYMVKPFTANVLKAKLDAILGNAEATKEPAEKQ